MAFNVFKGKPKGKTRGARPHQGLPKGVSIRQCADCGRRQRAVVGAQDTCSACGGPFAVSRVP